MFILWKRHDNVSFSKCTVWVLTSFTSLLLAIFILWLVKIWQVSSCRKFIQRLETCLLWQLKLTEFFVNNPIMEGEAVCILKSFYNILIFVYTIANFTWLNISWQSTICTSLLLELYVFPEQGPQPKVLEFWQHWQDDIGGHSRGRLSKSASAVHSEQIKVQTSLKNYPRIELLKIAFLHQRNSPRVINF